MKQLRKCLLCFVLAFALCASTLAIQPAESIEASKGGYITGSNVNLRSKPGSHGNGEYYPSLGQLQKGNIVQILSYKINWYKVKVSSGPCTGLTGWVYANYVSPR